MPPSLPSLQGCPSRCPVHADVASGTRVDISVGISAGIRGVRNHGGGSIPDSEDSPIGSEIGHFVDDRHYPQSHFRVGIWLVLCRCSRVDAACCQLSLADAQALPLGRVRKCGDDCCLTNAKELAGRTVESGSQDPDNSGLRAGSLYRVPKLMDSRRNQCEAKE